MSDTWHDAEVGQANAEAPAAGFACLVVIYGEQIGRRYAIDDQSLLVGRTPSCDVQLDDLAVSRTHCRIVPRGADAVVIDLDSTNKTFVNNVPVGEQVLTDGDRLTVGRTIFRYLCNKHLETSYHAELSRALTVDPLTGAFNRAHFEKELDFAFYRFRRYGRPSSLVLLELDAFQEITEQHGFVVGDHVLAHVGRLVFANLRAGDILARWDARIFALLLPETALQGAVTIARRLCERVAETPFQAEERQIAITASLGVVAIDATMNVIDELVEAAARRLAEAKGNGRNRVEPAPEQP